MIEILGSDTLFHLATKRTSYVLGVFGGRWLAHYYWGSRIEPDPSAMACLRVESAPYEVADAEGKRVSLNRLPLEYPYGLAGDFRRPAFEAYSGGRAVMDLSVASWRRYVGRPEIPGLPFARARGSKNVETFEVTLADGLTGFEARLSYTVFEDSDVIARSVLVSNRGDAPIDLLHACSFSVDLSLEGPGARREDLELLSLHGAWARERSIVRQPIRAGRIEVESLRGVSSHCASPNCALVRQSTDEESGDAWGFSLVYSGDWRIGCERSEEGDYRAQGGLNPSTFSWRLGPGEDFACPEALLSYSSEGLGGMSRNFHALVLDNLLPARWASAPRPILINNWEATYFDFDEERLLGIAAKAAELGRRALRPRRRLVRAQGRRPLKPRGLAGRRAQASRGLGGLADKVRALGLKFGLWIEPEMVSPDSDLYRAHPDWCLHMEGRPRTEGRNQLVLDLTRAEVRDYIVQRVVAALREARADYAKWDMNRPLSHAGAAAGESWMPQKELRHRYVLGLYEILDRITSALPDTLFEGCAGGGGRMDMGLLAYMPQYWASDNTDAIARLEIQYGTSLFFPPVTIGSHVSAVPNHQTGRAASLRLRGLVAMSANLGYELDPRTFSPEDAAAVAALNAWYKAHRELVQQGRFIRLSSPFEGEETAWSFVSEDGERALAFCFRAFARANQGRFRLRLRALKSELLYSVSAESGSPRLIAGSELMGRGLDFSPPAGEGGILLELLRPRPSIDLLHNKAHELRGQQPREHDDELVLEADGDADRRAAARDEAARDPQDRSRRWRGLLGLGHSLDRLAAGGLVGRTGQGRRQQSVGRACGLGVARLDDGHADAEFERLEPEGFGSGLEGVLAGAVQGLVGQSHAPRHRADVDDDTASLAPHDRQHGLAHPQGAEEIGVELVLGLLDRDVLDRPRQTIAGIVDQDVDPALGLLDAPHGRGDGSLIAHV